VFNKQPISTHREAITALTEGKAIIAILKPDPPSPKQTCCMQQLDIDGDTETWILQGEYTPDINFDDAYWLRIDDNDLELINTFEFLSENIEQMFACNRMIMIGEREHEDRMSHGDMMFALRNGKAIEIYVNDESERKVIQFNSEGNLVVYKGWGDPLPWELDSGTTFHSVLTNSFKTSDRTDPK